MIFCLSVGSTRIHAQISDTVDFVKQVRQHEDKLWGNYPKEFAYAKQLESQVQGSNCQSCISRAMLMMGKYYWADGLYKPGLKYMHQALRRASKYGDLQTVADCQDLIATTHYYQAYYDSAIYYYDKALQTYEGISNVEGQAAVLHNLSLLHHRRGNFGKTIEYIFKKEKFKEDHPGVLIEVDSYGWMGNLMIDTIYYNEKINEDLAQLNENAHRNDPTINYKLCFNLAKSYSQLKNYKQAVHYYKRMCEEKIKLNLRPDWYYVGLEYKNLNQPDSAFYYLHKSMRLSKENTQLHNSWYLELLGDTHLLFNRPDSALYYYNKVFQWNIDLNNRLSVAGLYNSLVKTHTALGNYEIAQQFLISGIQLAKEIAIIHQVNLYNSGKSLYEKVNDYKQAYYYQSKYLSLMDSINKVEMSLNLTQMQADFQTVNRKRELNKLQQENLINQTKIKTRNLQIGLSISIVILTISGGGFYYARYRQKKKSTDLLEAKNSIIENQNSELIKQNEEKEILMAEIHHRVKNNLQIMASLLNIKSRLLDADGEKAIQEVVTRISSIGRSHELLYKSQSLNSVQLNEYVYEQVTLLVSSLSDGAIPIREEFDLDPIVVNVETAMNLGLIINEFITNALKHAFPPTQTDRRLRVELRKSGSAITLSVIDNGLSVKENINEIKKSFGLRFVEQLVQSRHNGFLEINSENGFMASVQLNLIQKTDHG